jgi:hypothetical protein
LKASACIFDVEEQYAALSAAGDPPERLAAVVDFEIFWPVLEAALARSDRSRGGRLPYDAALMFRTGTAGNSVFGAVRCC